MTGVGLLIVAASLVEMREATVLEADSAPAVVRGTLIHQKAARRGRESVCMCSSCC